MTQYPNQFTQTPEIGNIDLQTGASNVLTCQVASTETVTLTAGMAVKLADVAGEIPKVLKCTADTDEVFGFVVRNLKDVGRDANEFLEIAIKGSVMYMKAGAAIARGARVEADVSENEVITSAGTNTIVGWALDKAAADGSIFRVYIETPYASLPAA